MSKTCSDAEYSKRHIAEISTHKEMFGLPEHIGDMNETDYRSSVEAGAFFHVDHHERLRSEFSGEVLAETQWQVDILIRQLETLKEKLKK